MEYRYTVDEDNNSIFLEGVGPIPLNPGDDPAEKAKQNAAINHNVPEKDVKVKKVDDLNTGVIDSNDTINK